MSHTGSRSPAELRALVRERDGDNCSICGKLIDFTRAPGSLRGPSLEHVVPIAAGGSRSDLANLRLAHMYPCNQAKGGVHRGVDYAMVRNREAHKPKPPALPRRVTHLQQSVGEVFWDAYLRAAEKAASERSVLDERYAHWIEEGARLLAADSPA